MIADIFYPFIYYKSVLSSMYWYLASVPQNRELNKLKAVAPMNDTKTIAIRYKSSA